MALVVLADVIARSCKAATKQSTPHVWQALARFDPRLESTFQQGVIVAVSVLREAPTRANHPAEGHARGRQKL